MRHFATLAICLSTITAACGRDRAASPAATVAEVSPPLHIDGRLVPAIDVADYLENRTGPEMSIHRCAYLPLAQRGDVTVLNTVCWVFRHDADTLIADSTGRVTAIAMRLAVAADSGKVLSHAFLDSASSDTYLSGFTPAEVAQMREVSRDTLARRLMFNALRDDASVAFGLQPDPRDTLAVHPGPDWITHADARSGIELRAPRGWLPEDWRVDPCTPASMPTDSSLGRDAHGAPSGGSLTIAMRRGTTAAALEANGFSVGPWGLGMGGRQMSGGSSVKRGGGRWIAMAGDYWFAEYAPEGGLLGQESTDILVGVVDLGGGCKLVWAGGSGGEPSLDTLAAVLSTVRRR